MQVYEQYGGSGSEEDMDASSVLRIQSLELALERAIENISMLQDNLGYVIRVKEELEGQLAVKEQREQALLKEFNARLGDQERQLESAVLREEELLALLEDAKGSLEQSEVVRRQREDEARRMERIVEDQKSTLHSLEEELLAVRYSNDLSCQSISTDNMRVQELERDNDQLRFELQKARGQCEREGARARKSEREAEQFKSWLAATVGLKRVVEGCESMLMEQISLRLSNCASHGH
jgi:hypothetical protein